MALRERNVLQQVSGRVSRYSDTNLLAPFIRGMSIKQTTKYRNKQIKNIYFAEFLFERCGLRDMVVMSKAIFHLSWMSGFDGLLH